MRLFYHCPPTCFNERYSVETEDILNIPNQLSLFFRFSYSITALQGLCIPSQSSRHIFAYSFPSWSVHSEIRTGFFLHASSSPCFRNGKSVTQCRIGQAMVEVLGTARHISDAVMDNTICFVNRIVVVCYFCRLTTSAWSTATSQLRCPDISFKYARFISFGQPYLESERFRSQIRVFHRILDIVYQC